MIRRHLEQRGIPHTHLCDRDAVNLGFAANGYLVIPQIPASHAAIDAPVWLASALAAHGRYAAPEIDDHPAELDDGGSLVDAAVLMLIVQRHFLTCPQPGWSDDELAAEFDLDQRDFARAQRVLDSMLCVVPPPGAGPQAMKPWLFRAYLKIMGCDYASIIDPDIWMLLSDVRNP